MFGKLNVPSLGTIVPVLGIAAALGVGWLVNGWRLEARIASLKASHAQAIADAQETARKREAALYNDFDKIRKSKDAQIKTIDARLAAALVSLHNRPDRLPQAASTCVGATGKELARPDAEFLTRYAADAQELQAKLNSCIASYESARKALK